VNEDVVTVRIETSIEDQWRVHEGTGVDETASLLDLHLLNIEHKATIENLEG
jgi:hypothetical protein